MALRGNLNDFTLPDVFQLIALSKKTGVLRMRRADGSEGNVWFREGEVFFAESNWHRERLGERLVTAQKITPSALARVLQLRAAEPENGRRLGRILVDEGYITDAVLEAFVRDQVLEPIFDLMRWEEGEFDFEMTPDTPEEDIGLAVSIENIVMEGARRLEEWERIKRKVPSMDLVFKMSTAPGEGSFEISLKPVEWNLLLLVDGTRSVAELARAAHWTEFDAARVVYGLYSAGLLEVVSDEDVARLRAEKVRHEVSLAASVASAPVAERHPAIEEPAARIGPLEAEARAEAQPVAQPETEPEAEAEPWERPSPAEELAVSSAEGWPESQESLSETISYVGEGLVSVEVEFETAELEPAAEGPSEALGEPEIAEEPTTGAVDIEEELAALGLVETQVGEVELEPQMEERAPGPMAAESTLLPRGEAVPEEVQAAEETVAETAEEEPEEAAEEGPEEAAEEVAEGIAEEALPEVEPETAARAEAEVEPEAEMDAATISGGIPIPDSAPEMLVEAGVLEGGEAAQRREPEAEPTVAFREEAALLIESHTDLGLSSSLTEEITALTGVERGSRPVAGGEASGAEAAVPRRDASIDKETLLDIIEGIKRL